MNSRHLFDTMLTMAVGATIAVRLGYSSLLTAPLHGLWVTAASHAQAAPAVQEQPSPLDMVEKVLKIVAYVVGASWVYFNYLRGRTYHQRLEPRLSGALVRDGKRDMVRAVVTVKNVGLSKVDIQQAGTGLRFLAWDETQRAGWRHLATVEVFLRHQWIEPGETIEDHAVIAEDLTSIIAVKLDLSVTSGRFMWQAVAVLT